MGNSLSLRKKHVPWSRLEKPARVALISLDFEMEWTIMETMATWDLSIPQVQHSAIQELWWNKLALPPHMNITSIQADDTGAMIGYGSRLQELVRGESDGIIFLVDAVERRSLRSDMLPYTLEKFVSSLQETEDSVLLVLLDHTEEEVGRYLTSWASD